MDEDPFVSDDSGPPGSVRGKLLLAGPLLLDPSFFRAVVLMLDHDEQGAFGLVVNRRSEIPLDSVLERSGPLCPARSVRLPRGPRGARGGIRVGARRVDRAQRRQLVTRWLGGRRSRSGSADVGPELTQLRIFSGYAGWGRDSSTPQLATEGGWIVVEAHVGDPFAIDTDDLWSAVLRRQRARWHAWPTIPSSLDSIDALTADALGRDARCRERDRHPPTSVGIAD